MRPARKLDPEEDENGVVRRAKSVTRVGSPCVGYGREFGIDQIELALNLVKADAQKAIF
jgi:hypothetical protein